MSAYCMNRLLYATFIKKNVKFNIIYQPSRTIFLRHIFNPIPTGLLQKGQGLVKDQKTNPNNFSYRFVQKRIKEQDWGKKYFPIFPDIIFAVKFIVFCNCCFAIVWLFYPRKYFSATKDFTLIKDEHFSVKQAETTISKLYSLLPLRIISSAWGRLSEFNIYSPLKPYVYGAYIKLFNINMNEAVETDLRQYPSMQSFFTREIKQDCRPIELSDIVSPSDGKVLHFGKVTKGLVEQVKGITYTVKSFFGPSKITDKSGIDCGDASSEEDYCESLLTNPLENDLYHCVIYLGPGDYHRFHSPVNWTLTHRRHIAGELFSVNPKVASVVKNLFVLNERVILKGKWKHGFFSMSAVGATNVGSIVMYNDPLLKTNRSKRVKNGYYDMTFNDTIYRGDCIGQFNLGSTLVLIFEAPKNFKFNVTKDLPIKYGQSIIK